MTATKITSKRVRVGHYEATVDGVLFTIISTETFSEGLDTSGQWHLFQGETGSDRYWNTFATKKDALLAIAYAVECGDHKN